jgi:TRAP-type C4-dicarboxylate transport system substrate-binding protein
MTIGIGIGATVVTKSQWDLVSAENQAKVLEIAKKHHVKLREAVRKKNKEAVAQLKKEGIEVVSVPQAEVDRFLALAAKVRADLAAKMFKPGLLDRVEKLIKDIRGK